MNVAIETSSSSSSESEADESDDTSYSDASWEDRDHVTCLSYTDGFKKQTLRKRLSTVSEEFLAEV